MFHQKKYQNWLILNLDSLRVTYANLFSLNVQKHWNELMKNNKIAFNDAPSYKIFITMYNESLINPDVLINYNNNETNNDEYLKYNKLISPIKFTFEKDSIQIKNLNDEKNHFINALQGKRILIINNNINNFKNKYNKEIFKNCEFIYLQPSVKIPWFNNYLQICKEIKNNETQFDIALVDCYGYSNLVSFFIYNNINKSAISLENNLNYLLK